MYFFFSLNVSSIAMFHYVNIHEPDFYFKDFICLSRNDQKHTYILVWQTAYAEQFFQMCPKPHLKRVCMHQR